MRNALNKTLFLSFPRAFSTQCERRQPVVKGTGGGRNNWLWIVNGSSVSVLAGKEIGS